MSGMIGETSPSAGAIRLRTLGTLDLTGPDAPGLSAFVSQPKRAALLVYLAFARPRGLQRRDKLLALLWPESDQSRARHALSQLVYQLRRTLGAEALLSRGDEALGIDGAKLWCDAVAFESALETKRLEEALELYRGDFMAGVHVPDAAPELEEWISTERIRLRTAAADAAWSLSARDEAAANGTAAAHWARRAAALAPDDENAVRRLVGLLGKVGDRAGALRVYDEFARRLHQEFAIKPSPELRALAEDLRRTPAGMPMKATVPPPDPPTPGVDSPPNPTRRRQVRWRWISAAAIAAALVGVMVFRSLQHNDPAPILAVGAIADYTHGDTAAPATVVVDLLATSLARLSSVRVLATARLYEVQSQLQAATRSRTSLYDAARAAGAQQLIQGTLHSGALGGIRLDLERIDIQSGSARNGYRAEGRDLFAAIDQATTAIARDFGVQTPEAPVADVTTHSLIAYRLYEEGLRAYYQADHLAADRLFRSALVEDSTFAMAAYWVGVTARDRGQDPIPYFQRAARLAERATDRERLVIRQTLAELQLDSRTIAFAETLAVRYPLEPDGQLALSRVRFLTGDFLAGIEPARRVLVLDSLSLGGRLAQCRACEAYTEIMAMYTWADSLPAAVRTAREWVSRQPSFSGAWGNLVDALVLSGQDDAALGASRTADSISPGSFSEDVLRAQLALRHGDHVDADQRLRRLQSEHGFPDAEWFLAISLRDQGRLAEASTLTIAKGHPLRPQLLFERGRWREAAVAFETVAHLMLAPSQPLIGHPAKNLAFNLTHVATCLAAAGDTGRLAALADSVEAAGRESVFGRERRLGHYIRGLLLAARGQWEPAAVEYRNAIFSWNEGYTRVNYELAKALLHLGRPRDAIAALQPAFRGSLEAANLYITRTELHELLAQAFDSAGMRDSALVHWRAVESAWRNADPEFRRRWEFARQRLTVGR